MNGKSNWPDNLQKLEGLEKYPYSRAHQGLNVLIQSLEELARTTYLDAEYMDLLEKARELQKGLAAFY
jgi:hypothetical protein